MASSLNIVMYLLLNNCFGSGQLSDLRQKSSAVGSAWTASRSVVKKNLIVFLKQSFSLAANLAQARKMHLAFTCYTSLN